MQRCAWLTQDTLYIEYHDKEWGIAQTDGKKLFEKLCLEGQQAGLSWITVLKKREHYRHCFYHFDPHHIAQMQPADVDRLMLDAGLIRHRGKIDAIINNAKAWLAMEAQGEDFAHFIWSFVDHNTRVNHFATMSEIPASTPASLALSKALKKRGFKFIGPTTCYALMQSCGLVNDHTTDCFCHPDNQR